MGQIQVASGSSAFGAIIAIDRVVAKDTTGQTGNYLFLVGADAGRNSSVDNLIGIGAGALSAGIADTNLAGTVAIGVNAGQAYLQLIRGDLPSVFIGQNAAQHLTQTGSHVIIGANAFKGITGGSTEFMTVIGAGALGNSIDGSNGRNHSSVVIGSRALSGAFAVGVGSSVFIGDRVGANAGIVDGVAQPSNSVVIGYAAGLQLGGGNGNTIIGFQAGQALVDGFYNTLIGGEASCQESFSNTLVGYRSFAGTGGGNIVLGVNSATPNGSIQNIVIGNSSGVSGLGHNNIVLGSGVGPTTLNNTFSVESVNSIDGKRYVGIYANMPTDVSEGGLIVGFSTYGVDRDTPGRNVLKIIDGSGVYQTPIGGGYFYSLAGALHWKGTAGTDTVIAPA